MSELSKKAKRPFSKKALPKTVADKMAKGYEESREEDSKICAEFSCDPSLCELLKAKESELTKIHFLYEQAQAKLEQVEAANKVLNEAPLIYILTTGVFAPRSEVIKTSEYKDWLERLQKALK